MVVAGAAAGALAALLPPIDASAFKGGDDFRKSASSGGGGGMFFTGAPAYRRWDCTICHVEARKTIRIHLDADPPDLLATGRWKPDSSYRITIRMLGEHRGLGSRRNTNGLGVTLADGRGAAAGSFGFGDAFTQGNHETEIVTSGREERLTEWSFTWNTPASGAGRVTLHVAMVDGDGGSRTDASSSDAFHDDVAVGGLAFDEGPP